MALPDILTSIHGRRLGLTANGLLVFGEDGGSRSALGLVYANTAASSAISNTTSETAFDVKATIKANRLYAGALIKIRFQGIATSTNSTDTLAVKLRIGGLTGTTLLSLAATDVANNDVFQGEYELIVRTVGASGTIVGCGTAKSVPAAEGTMTIKDDILASTTIDTTVDQDIVVTGQWSAASASDSCRLDFLRMLLG